ncbi:MAG: hypothetical protein ACFCUG_01965 [Thiotrichales bacterium]
MVDRKGDTAHAHCRETIRALLTISALQVELALSEGGGQIEKLGELVMKHLDVASRLGSDREAALCPASTSAQSSIENALKYLQFYDRLSQRLMHVASGLRLMGDHLEGAGTEPYEIDCREILRKIHDSYVLEDEKRIFSRVLSKDDLISAHIPDQLPSRVSTTSPIELF